FIDGCALSRLHSLRSWPLLQYSEEAEYGLRVLNAAIVDHLEGFRAVDDVDFDDFIFVRIDLCLLQAGCFVEIHELCRESRRRPESGALNHLGGFISRFFFQFADCAAHRIFPLMQSRSEEHTS